MVSKIYPRKEDGIEHIQKWEQRNIKTKEEQIKKDYCLFGIAIGVMLILVILYFLMFFVLKPLC